MNMKKWVGKEHSVERWFAKLAEEFGEVANEMSNLYDLERDNGKALLRMCDELYHVEVIAQAFRADLETRLGV